MKNQMVLCCLLALTTLACNKKVVENDSLAVDPVEASVESGLTVVSGMADEQSGSSLALRSEGSEPAPSIWHMMMGPKAFAETCTRAYFASCASGVKSVTYNQCDIIGTSRTLYGNVNLTYSNGGCTLSSNGDSVTRTYDLEINGPRGGLIRNSSTSKVDYRGTTYGGGGQVTKVASGWQIAVLGRNTTMSFRGKSLFDISVRTLAPLNVTGALSRSGRTLNGGQLEVNHNIAGFTAVFAPTNLTWSNSCCHPTSGSLAVTYSGSKTGSATVTFNGCGSASVDQGGQVSAIQLSYCE